MKIKRMIGNYEPGEKGETFEEISARMIRNQERMAPKVPKNNTKKTLAQLMGFDIDLSTKK